MCTCIHLKTEDTYFGRNLDLEYRFGEKVVITPRNYDFRLKNGTNFKTLYSMIGISSVVQDYPLYAEAANEKGLAMAGLHFPQNARFFEPKDSKTNLAPYELIPYLLGRYASVSEIRDILPDINITNIPFLENLPVTDLHWMISDEKESIVVEQVAQGLMIYDNPIGILTNNPPFPYHLSNMNNYMHLTPQCPENHFSDKITLKPYGRGMGAIGLPGDTSPASRFIRAAFHKLNSICDSDEESSVTQFFHLLDSVALVSGSTITEKGTCDITNYSCCINTTKGIFYYKTYANNQITAVRMGDAEKNKKELTIFELVEKQQIRYEN